MLNNNTASLWLSFQDLSVINADESQVFIAGSQPSSGLFYSLSELYLSDTRGQVYISSLEHVTSVGLKEVSSLTLIQPGYLPVHVHGVVL